MDVLFGSIDVRDLLSTQDFEESSPLSAPDLRLLIDKLQIRSFHIKQRVRDYVLSHRSDFSDIFSRCSLAASKTDEIAADVDDLLKLISDRPIDVEVRDIEREIRSARRELKEKNEALVMVEIIAALIERLRSTKEGLRNGRLIEAAEAVRDLKKAIIGEEVEDGREPLVFGLLRKEWSDCFDEMQEVLVKIMGKAVQFEMDNGRVRVLMEIDGVELRTVLSAMDIVGILDYGLAKVADLMIKYVMVPIVHNASEIVFVEELNQGSEQKAEVVLNLVQSSDSQVEYLNGSTIYSKIIQILKFIYKSICFNNGRWMRCLGRLTWPRISELVIANFLSKVVPDEASKVAEFQNIVKLTIEFETALKEIMFISATDSVDEKLSTFAQNVEVHFASRKKKEILAKARNLLLQCEFVLSSENTVEFLFQPERCLVSKPASQLMELVHQTLQDVCLSSMRVAMEFYHAARDALLLYEAIVPVKLEKQLDSINQVSIVMHNDCLYLSQEIFGLAFEYRSDFPSCVKEHAVFVDMAPNFCQMAEEILQKQIQFVSFSLKEAIDGADGFQNTHQMQQYESAKFSIDQVVFILEKVHIIWEPLLLPSTYKRGMCIILDSVFSRITKDILLLDDLAAEETIQLQRLIHMILENLSSLFESLVAVVHGKEKFSENFLWIQLHELLPSLHKLHKLSDLLDMPLTSITTAWESGELINCGFTSSEVQNFVKAIFTDSPLRKECLWRIESSQS